MMRAALLAGALICAPLLTSCFTPAKPTLQGVGQGAYQLEKSHASVVWRVKHMGLSWYTARFTDLDATLDFNPNSPVSSHVRAIINPMSVQTAHPTNKEWDGQLGRDWFKGAQFPQIVFDSTAIERTGDLTGKVTGALTFLGVTKPVTLDVTYNGVNHSPFFGARDIVGFSAHGVLKRSDFGLTKFASIAGDEVDIVIETEFVQKP